MRKNGFLPLLGIMALVGIALVATIAAGFRPLLGIDLTGGVEGVLVAVDNPDQPDGPTNEDLDQAVEILRNRVDALAVAQPDITRQGDRIVVQLPDVEDQQRAIELIGTTAELQFRPVCAVVPIAITGIPPESTDAVVPSVSTDNADCVVDLAALSAQPTTRTEDIDRDQPVLLEQRDSSGEVITRYYLGPVPSTTVAGETAYLLGSAVETADAFNSNFNWTINLTMHAGDGGIGLFNDMSSQCYSGTPICPFTGVDAGNSPRGRMAIVLDGNVESSPTIGVPAFERSGIQISGAFTQAEAEDTALVLRYGSLPIQLDQQRVRTVSSSLGSDSLRAGIISGIIGLSLVAAYMIWYYRMLGVAALLSLFVSGAMLWILVSFFSETGFFFSGVTLTIAGVVGLIVSMGVSLDSNVVYFEHIKEDIVSGRILMSAVDRSFPVAYRTIFWANMASLIGAFILYVLTVSSVREFAFMLGLASILDLVATYFFLRPLVKILSRTSKAERNPRWMGLPTSKGEATT